MNVNSITDGQRRKLCEMMYHAFVDLRLLGWARKPQQVVDLAGAFHNLPKGIWKEKFSLRVFRKGVETYQLKYPGEFARDYVAMVDEIISME